MDDELLSAFSKRFYGYGTYSAPFWFVGMEEGGGGSEAEITARLRAWDVRGRRELEDVADYHREIGITKHWVERPVLQTTWNRLIRLLLAYKGRDPDVGQVREYQRAALGRSDGETSLLELLPLPSPGTNRWLYGELSGMDELSDRDTYIRSFSAWRGEHIRSRLEENRPTFVVFYGMQYLPYWRAITQTALDPVGDLGFYSASQNGTTLIAAQHPAAHGASNDYFQSIGRWIASEASKATQPPP